MTAVDYWLSGQIKQITYGNGVLTYYDQNNRLWPTSFVIDKSGLYTYTQYYYDTVGNLLFISDLIDPINQRELNYDALN